MKEYVKKIFNFKTLFIIQLILLVYIIYSITVLNIFPNKMIYMGLVVFFFLLIIEWFLKYKFVGRLLCVMIFSVEVLLVPYLSITNNTISKITEVGDEVSRVSLFVMNNTVYQKICDVENKNIQINTKYNVVAMGATMNQLNELISCNYSSEDDFIKMATNLYEGNVDAILVNEAYLWVIEHKYESFNEDTRVIWTYEYKKEKENIKKPVTVANETFNVFVSGIDIRGPVSTVSKSDVNMIATVNTTNNQVLLTSIPRDYYVYISELKAKDKLTHAGLNGVNSSVSTLEDLLNIDINYYVKVNFSSLIMMVDALGGIEVELPYSISSPGMRNYFKKGVNYINGDKALVLSRERHYLTDGDNERIKNQQRVIQGMLNKLISPAIITNYMDILDSVAGSFETNMSTKEITDLLKEQLKTMKSWDVQSYSLTGTGSYFKGGAMMPDTELYYCIPNEQSIQKATDYINQMMDGEIIKVE